MNQTIPPLTFSNNFLFVFDLDGTLADDSYRKRFLPEYIQKNPEITDKETEHEFTCYFNAIPTDKLITPIAKILESVARANTADIDIVTARPDRWRYLTETWLRQQALSQYIDRLMMRETGDYRGDHDVKYSIYEKEIKPHYDNVVWFDDKPSVIKHFRSMNPLGFTMIDVGEGQYL